MIKELLKYLLPLCILLVDGYSNMYAGSQEGRACISSVQILTKSQHPNFVQAFDDNDPAYRLPDAARKFSQLIKAISEEKEEDSSESSSLKKHTRTDGALAASCSPRRIFAFFDTPKGRPLAQCGLFISSHRYLRLRVLRI